MPISNTLERLGQKPFVEAVDIPVKAGTFQGKKKRAQGFSGRFRLGKKVLFSDAAASFVRLEYLTKAKDMALL